MAHAAAAVHSVHFYEEDAGLIERLRGIVASGLQIGNSILVVATAAHREQLVKGLDKLGVDIRGAVREGRFERTPPKRSRPSC